VVLSEADLIGANLVGVVLTGASLNGANLSSTHLADADMSKALLAGADLSGASFSTAYGGLNVNLTGADPRGANLDDLTGLAFITGTPYYDGQTTFDSAELEVGVVFDPISSGWNLVSESSVALLLDPDIGGIAARRRSST